MSRIPTPALATATSATAEVYAQIEMKNTMPSRVKRQGSFILVIAAALAVAACTGRAGVDIPIGPVDHSCHVNNSARALGSGCA
jgi:hypothetical protein